ncbi:hypothetical protein ACQY0O_001228 [Thecaphora frezii]
MQPLPSGSIEEKIEATIDLPPAVKLSSSQDVKSSTTLPFSPVRVKRPSSAPVSPQRPALSPGSSQPLPASSSKAPAFFESDALLLNLSRPIFSRRPSPARHKVEDDDSNTEILPFEDDESTMDHLDEEIIPVRSGSPPHLPEIETGTPGPAASPQVPPLATQQLPVLEQDETMFLAESQVDPLALPFLASPSPSPLPLPSPPAASTLSTAIDPQRSPSTAQTAAISQGSMQLPSPPPATSGIADATPSEAASTEQAPSPSSPRLTPGEGSHFSRRRLSGPEVVIEIPAQRRYAPASHSSPSQPAAPSASATAVLAAATAAPDDETVARAAAMLPPSPPRRNLRARKAQQLNPYTLEAIRYQRALVRNDWEDALVSQREWARQEKRRIREEAARAAAEAGSTGESQSQWLVPDPEDEAQEESWRREEEREMKRKAKAAQRQQQDAAAQPKAKSPAKKPKPSAKAATSARQPQASRQPAPASSQSDSYSELDLPAPRSVAATAAPSMDTAGPSRTRPTAPTTYARRGKGKGRPLPPAAETPQRPEASESRSRSRSASPRPSSFSSSSPVLGSRKNSRIRSLSRVELISSDTEQGEAPAPQARQSPSRSEAAVHIESSADEAPLAERDISSASRKRLKKRRELGFGSSSDSTDYERRFRQLKKMMPAGMARKHIEDLRAMRHGKAYHSDGHVSSTPDASEQSDGEDGDATVVAAGSTPSTSPLDAGELRPGEARKRMRRRSLTEGEPHGLSLLFPADSEPETEKSSSSSSEPESDDGVLGLWTDRTRRERFREADAIDRMLSRTNGEKWSPKRSYSSEAKRRRPKQSRLDPHLVEQLAAVTTGSGGARRAPKTHVEERSASGAARSSTSGHKRKRTKHHDPRVGRARSSHRGPAVRPSNPPIVRPRTRPRLDLVNDDILFDFQLAAEADTTMADDPDDDLISMLEDLSTPAPIAASAAILEGVNGAINGARHPRTVRRTASATSHGAWNQPPNDAGLHTPSPLHHIDRNNTVSPAQLPRQAHLHMRTTPQAKSPVSDFRPAPAVSSPAAHSPVPAAAAANLDAQRAEAETWDEYEGLRVDFGIRPLPVGLGFASQTFLGKGRLYELLHLPDYLEAPERALPSNWTRLTALVGEHELAALMSVDEVIGILPSLFETLAQAAELGSADHAIEGAAAATTAPVPKHRTQFEEASRFLCLRLTAEALEPVLSSQLFRLYRAITKQIDLLFQRLRRRSAAGLEALLQLLWFRVEICWRLLGTCGQDQAALYGQEAATYQELVNSSKLLMLLLLRHGLHKTMRAVKAVADAAGERDRAGTSEDATALASQPAAAAAKLTDTSAEIWICLIHLLDQAGQQETGGELVSFWSVFESALTQWHAGGPRKRSVINSESIWYCIFSLCALSHVSASTGTVFSTSHLGPCWPVVARALATVRFRFDESVESTMSLPALNKRDQYIRVVLRRCFDLSVTWHWKMDGAELALSRLFEIFNSHKLTDLPSESDHDFPQFLREFDEATLMHEAGREDSCFHVFLKLVARAGCDLRSSAVDGRDGDRRISRLFSRITPVRTMAFTRSDVPTSSQRSMLFNHYGVVMLFLYLVPSQASQRLRQIKSFLQFKQADYASQVACVRAMMYAAVILRHHQLDVSPIAMWFGEVTSTMMKEYEALEKTTGTQKCRPGAAPLAPVFEEAQARQKALRRQGEVARLIVAVLRSLQHVIQHPTLSKSDRSDVEQAAYPDLNLLHSSWTKDILEAQLAVDPAIGQEALKCIHTFLLQRNRAVTAARPKPAKEAPTTSEESQDSFGDLFDDVEFDFDDPALDNLLGAGQDVSDTADTAAAVPPPVKACKELDREFANYAISVISPALFRLVSNLYHPDRRAEGLSVSLGVTERLASCDEPGRLQRRTRLDRLVKEAERRRYLEAVIDCWAGCAHVLVQNGLRDWTSYLTFGNESWKRIDDPVGKRDVGLRFLLNVLMLDPEAFGEHEGEFGAMWCQAAVARVLSVQHRFTAKLWDAGQGSVVCRGWRERVQELGASSSSSSTAPASQQTLATTPTNDNSTDPTLKLQDFETLRFDLLCTTLANLSADAERKDPEAVRRRPMVFSCLSALLSALRLYVEDTPDEAKERQGYLEFCERVIGEVRRIGPTLMRGVGSEVATTEAVVRRKRGV